MPFARRRKRALVRRRRRKMTIPTQIKDQQLVKLRYSTTVNVNPAYTVATVSSFRANSIYDPNPLAGGQQPLGHDQWQTMYKRYCVKGAKLTAYFMPRGASVTNNYICSVRCNTDATPSASPIVSTMVEQKNTKWTLVKGIYGGKPSKLTSTFSLKKMFTTKDVDDDQYSANFGSNPGEQAYFHVCTSAVNTGDDPDSIDLVILIEYIVQMDTPIELAQS